MTVPYRARWWTKLDDGRFRCDLCPRSCTVRPGQRAFCYVRRADEDGFILDTYGRSSGFCIDPIEKKPLNHFLPGTPVLSFGTAGCNLGCRFCQNWDISKAREQDSLMDTASPADIAEAALRTGCRSVAFTYNDPVIFAEYAIDTAAECRKRGIRTVAVTAGWISAAARAEFYGAIDAVNIDLKAFTEDFYQRLCFADLEAVKETIAWVCNETDTHVELTTLLIPGENDDPAEIDRLTRWVLETVGPDVPLHFSAFHPDYKMLDKPRTPPAALFTARQIARANGVHHVYCGNIHDTESDTTYCPSCGEALIVRDWYRLLEWRMQGDHCGSCGTRVAGVFEANPGSWGARRQPVRIGGDRG